MNDSVRNKRVAILVADGFEQVEFTEPKKALEDAGVETVVVSINDKQVRGFHHSEPADSFDVDMGIDQASQEDFHALLIPGGVFNPDALRGHDGAIAFTRSFFKHHKPVFAICHGPQVLITAGVVEGRNMTSYKTVRVDLENAGANWKDEAVVVDSGLVTSRNPDDIPAFNAKIIEELGEGRHTGQHA